MTILLFSRGLAAEDDQPWSIVEIPIIKAFENFEKDDIKIQRLRTRGYYVE